MLSSFERLNSPKTAGVVLTLVVALLAGILFFVYLPSRADERSLARAPAPASAPGELLEGGEHPPLKPPLGLNVEPAARGPEAPPIEAEADTEATGQGTNAPAREESEGPPRHPPENASLAGAPVGGVSAASTAAAASSASTAATTTAGTAQYASASTAQYGGAAAIRGTLTMVPRRAALQRSP